MTNRAELGHRALWLGAAVCGTVAVVLLIVFGSGAELLQPAKDAKGSINGLTGKLDSLKGPATAAALSIAFIGVSLGGAMLGLGMQAGMRVLMYGGGAGLAIGAGRGILE
jgi:hypothetical protein